jgi:hypothetical protein
VSNGSLFDVDNTKLMEVIIMSKFGLTKERYEQMMEVWGNDEEAVKDVVYDWGPDSCNKGYEIFNFDGTGMLEIEAIGDVGCFDDDEATEQAIKDGIKIIPVEELPEKFNRKYLGWIDTEANRKAIQEYCNKYC